MDQERFNYLIAEDEFAIAKIITDMLNIHPNTSMVLTAQNGLEALEIYKQHNIDIVITDILMPHMSGIELIKRIREINPDAQILIESAFSDIDLVRDAMRNGAYDYVLKPFTIDDMMSAIDRLIERIRFLNERKDYVKLLEQKVHENTRRLKNNFVETLSALVFALSVRDKYTHSHSMNVAQLSVNIGERIGMSSEQVENMRIAGIMHDIGKIAIPDSILLKPAKLTDAEYETIKTHSAIGKDIIFSSMRDNPDVIDFVHFHHERFDGRGYPRGLSGEDIPLVARVACLADSFDAMSNDRLYHQKKTLDQAIEEIKLNFGKQFDPEIGNVFVDFLSSRTYGDIYGHNKK